MNHHSLTTVVDGTSFFQSLPSITKKNAGRLLFCSGECSKNAVIVTPKLKIYRVNAHWHTMECPICKASFHFCLYCNKRHSTRREMNRHMMNTDHPPSNQKMNHVTDDHQMMMTGFSFLDSNEGDEQKEGPNSKSRAIEDSKVWLHSGT